MNDAEQAAIQTDGPRRFGRLIGTAILFCVVALLLALTLWSARPKWYTFVSKPTATVPRYILLFEVPAGWGCSEIGRLKTQFTAINIGPKPATGFARWWRGLLHLDTERLKPDSFFIRLDVEDSASKDCITRVKQAFQQIDKQFRTTLQRNTYQTFQHRLGPGLLIQETYSNLLPVPLRDRYEETRWIALHRHPKRQSLIIYTLYEGPKADFSRTQATWEEIVRSIRVVQK